MSIIISNIKGGDIVRIDKSGRRFHALVTETPTNGAIRIQPIEKWSTYYTATSREIIGHWIATKATRQR